MNPRRRLPGLHVLVHVALLLLGWWGFCALWWQVFRGHWETQALFTVVVGAAIAFPLVTVAWVVHNRRLYRRLGPRRAVPPAALNYARDFNGRDIVADWPALQAARDVQIRLEGNVKRYVAEPLPE